jgi:ATP-dependent Clp protease ATP-binding subunit ClpA
VERLAEEGYSREFGARNVGRIIEDRIKSFFVDEVLFGSLSEGGSARVDFREGEYRVEILESGEPLAPEEAAPQGALPQGAISAGERLD